MTFYDASVYFLQGKKKSELFDEMEEKVMKLYDMCIFCDLTGVIDKA